MAQRKHDESPSSDSHRIKKPNADKQKSGRFFGGILKEGTDKQRKMIRRLAVLAIVAAVGVLWYRSDLWPWPSEERRQERLDMVLDVCTNNEDSEEFKDLQRRWDITFEYCQKWSDIREYGYGRLGIAIRYDSNGNPVIRTAPYYATARENSSGRTNSNTEGDQLQAAINKLRYNTMLYLNCEESLE